MPIGITLPTLVGHTHDLKHSRFTIRYDSSWENSQRGFRSAEFSGMIGIDETSPGNDRRPGSGNPLREGAQDGALRSEKRGSQSVQKTAQENKTKKMKKPIVIAALMGLLVTTPREVLEMKSAPRWK